MREIRRERVEEELKKKLERLEKVEGEYTCLIEERQQAKDVHETEMIDEDLSYMSMKRHVLKSEIRRLEELMEKGVMEIIFLGK